MIIRVDEEGKKRINDLCDAALRVAGLKAFPGVFETLQAMEVIHDSPGRVYDDRQPDAEGGTKAVGGKVPVK